MIAPPQEPHLVQALAGIVVAGIGAHWLAARLRLPAILLLLLSGLLLGPVLGLVRPDALLGDALRPLVSLAVAIILFEGGLSLRLGEARRLGRPLLGLVLGGLVATFVLASLLARHLAGLDGATAAVLGAILVVTGPTVVRPMLRQAGLARRPAALLKWEGIVNDPLGALLAVLVLEVAAGGGGGPAARALLTALPLLLAAGVAGVAAGLLLARAMDRGLVPEHLKAPAALAVGLGLYAAAEAVHPEAGLLAVTVLGVALANSGSASIEDVRRFKEDATTLLVSLLFVVLAARLQPADLRALTGPALLFVAAVVFVVRPLAVGLGTLGSGLPWRERLLLGWVAPRGVVAAAVGAALAPRLADAGHTDANLLVPVLFAVILTTVVLHGFTVGPLARRLGLASRGGGCWWWGRPPGPWTWRRPWAGLGSRCWWRTATGATSPGPASSAWRRCTATSSPRRSWTNCPWSRPAGSWPPPTTTSTTPGCVPPWPGSSAGRRCCNCRRRPGRAATTRRPTCGAAAPGGPRPASPPWRPAGGEGHASRPRT